MLLADSYAPPPAPGPRARPVQYSCPCAARALAFPAALRDAVGMTWKGNLLRSTTLAALCAFPVLLLGSAPRARAAEPAAPEPVLAIWKDQELAVFFQTQTTFYSCSSLEAKIEDILKVLGARAVVKVRSVDCTRGPVRMPRVLVNLHAPVLATPEELAERDKGKSTRELTARVRGEK